MIRLWQQNEKNNNKKMTTKIKKITTITKVTTITKITTKRKKITIIKKTMTTKRTKRTTITKITTKYLPFPITLIIWKESRFMTFFFISSLAVAVSLLLKMNSASIFDIDKMSISSFSAKEDNDKNQI